MQQISSIFSSWKNKNQYLWNNSLFPPSPMPPATTILFSVRYFSYSLWIAMLLARNAWHTHLSPHYFHYSHCPHCGHVVAGPALVVLIKISGHTSAKNCREFWRTRFITQILQGTQHARGYTVKSQVKRESVWGHVALPLLGIKGEVSKVLLVLPLWAILKHRSGNWKDGRSRVSY